MTVVKKECSKLNVNNMRMDVENKEDSLLKMIIHIEERMIEMQINKIKYELKLNEEKLINNLRKRIFMIMSEYDLGIHDLALNVDCKAEDIDEALHGSGSKNQRIILSEICIYLINKINRKFG